MNSSRVRSPVAVVLALFSLALPATALQVKTPFVNLGREGRLTYTADAQGNRVPDFSSAGYRGGGVPLPSVVARVRVTPAEGDDGSRIQAAIDHVSSLPADARGSRGAVVLAPGRFEIAGHLRIAASGVVLQGAGAGEGGTTLVATGTDRRALVQIAGRDGFTAGDVTEIADAYVPVGATVVTLARGNDLRVGDRVLIRRPSPKEWIEAVGMHDAPAREAFAWRAGAYDVAWERMVVGIEGPRVTLDAPLTTALDRKFGGATLRRVQWNGRLSDVGVEHLRCESVYDSRNARDEEHAWMAIAVEDAENVWISQVTAVHFVSSAVQLGRRTRHVTVQDCASLAPVSEIGGYRRHAFHTGGQLTLFQRCRSERGMHDFTVGHLAAGPNVFLDCTTSESVDWSGSIGSWASGVLFDNVRIDGAGLCLDNHEVWNQGVGWSAANSVLWQSSAAVVKVRRPPTANNWAIGVWGEFHGDGWWDQANEFVQPGSLYVTQLRERRGDDAVDALAAVPRREPATSVPSLEQAVPDLAARLAPKPREPGRPLAMRDGWLSANDALLVGRAMGEMQWWRGHVLPSRAAEYGPSLTRFAPGLTGAGLTDDLGELTDAMVAQNRVSLRHHYGLWYDRRRMDHQRVRRATADVWPPFFEQPFARSGEGEAWDRLSRYDLTRYNPWYFRRLREFAQLGRDKGLVLVNEMYFQHNILEAGAHWADFPWRPANAIQPTGFPEPPPYTDNDGNPQPTPDLGKRIFMAEAFYDVSHPVRRPLHRAYIRQCLQNLAEEPNVIHTLTAENSGPLGFMQFWLDVVAEWERETGRRPLVALSAPKDVQDAILADPVRSAIVDVIDLQYWWRTGDGKLYAPAGGTRLAPRQHERGWRGGRPTAASLAGMVREYRTRFPGKAVITGLEQGDGWAFVAAGGSLPNLPQGMDPELRRAIPKMKPVGADAMELGASWGIGEPGRQYLIYVSSGGGAPLELKGETGTFEARRIDPSTGRVTGDAAPVRVEDGSVTALPTDAGAGVWWLVRK